MAYPPAIVAAEGAADHCMVFVACKTLRVMLRSTVSVACKIILRCTVHFKVLYRGPK